MYCLQQPLLHCPRGAKSAQGLPAGQRARQPVCPQEVQSSGPVGELPSHLSRDYSNDDLFDAQLREQAVGEHAVGRILVLG